MFDVPADTIYVWIGVATVSVAALGVVTMLPTAAPPDATAVGNTVDRIAVGPPGATATATLDATEIRLGPKQLSLRNDGGAASATFAYGPVTPTFTDDRLELVLHGHPVEDVFATGETFEQAVSRSQTRTDWQLAPAEITVRRVTWGGTDVTLVG